MIRVALQVDQAAGGVSVTDKTAATGEEADSPTEASDITAKPEEVAASAESTDIPASTDEQKHIDTSRDKEKDHEEAFKVNDKLNRLM